MAARIKVLLLLSKEVSPKSKALVNFESLSCNMDMSIFLIVLRRANRSSEWLEQWSRSWEIVSISPFPQPQKGLRESWKLCSLRWLKPSLTRDRRFIPLGLWKLNMLLADGLMNYRILFLKVAILSELLIYQPNLLHSIIVEGRKVFLKKSCSTFIVGILLDCLILSDILCIEIIE